MKTFYIPTSTSNFNNILSSESISPKAFYEKRGFGYSRWTTIPENPYNNAVVLYDNLCFFNRPKSDIEDHPLLVEVQLEESELKQTEGFWYSDHTIYLAPTTTRFLFFSETDKTITLSMSENSSETKLMRLYSKRIYLIEKPNEAYKPLHTGEPCPLNESEIDKDLRINKMKGLLHGYYIGALLSTNLDSVKYLNTLKEIHNIFAAILSSFDRQPTPYQNARLDVLFKAINRKNTDYQQLFKIIGDDEKIDKLMALDFVRPRDVVSKTDYLYYLQQEHKDAERENPAIEWIKGKIKNVKKNINQDLQLLSPNKSEIVVLGYNVSVLNNNNVINETEKNLCLAWFNKTLSSKETNGKISTYRERLADEITDEAIEVLGNNWKESGTRTYLNALRHHIAGEEFKQEWRNGLLSSIAAVIIAGDDWQKLLAFMQTREMTDYKLAFAIYGELNGFANLIRDFTDLLYNQDSSYVWDVYKEFFGQLFEVSLSLNKNEINHNVTENTQLSNSTKKAETTKPTINHVFNNPNAIEQKKDDYRNKFVQRIIMHPKYNEQKHNRYIAQIMQINLNDWNKIRSLSTKSDGWRGLIDDLAKKPKTNKSDLQQTSIFDEKERYPIGNYFYCDNNVWYYLEPLIEDKKTKKQIKDDLEWLQKKFTHPKGKRGYNYDDVDEKDNKTVIEKFCNLKRGKDANGKEKAPYYTEKLRECIRKKLMDLYNIK